MPDWSDSWMATEKYCMFSIDILERSNLQNVYEGVRCTELSSCIQIKRPLSARLNVEFKPSYEPSSLNIAAV